ncbi:MAG TPA: IS1 family transposase [Chitinophagaceae bacterium]|nr:IS1 family transposase [Chitinophagaceae bacterium]
MVSSCFKLSDVGLCRYCFKSEIVKNGRTKTGKQQYYCKSCKKRFLDYYTYQAYLPLIPRQIIELTKKGMGIRNTAAYLKISATTLLKRILMIAERIKQPVIAQGKTYEVDEMKSFIKHKKRKIWIAYALEKCTKTVVSFSVGARTNKTLNVVLKTLQHSEAKRVYTDKLPAYRFLLPSAIHSTNLLVSIQFLMVTQFGKMIFLGISQPLNRQLQWQLTSMGINRIKFLEVDGVFQKKILE